MITLPLAPSHQLSQGGESVRSNQGEASKKREIV
jgi:hypothetical protein